MSTLFSTAKLEMRRKDNEIAKLRKLYVILHPSARMSSRLTLPFNLCSLERERKAAGVNLDSIRTYCLRVQVEYDSFKKSIAKAGMFVFNSSLCLFLHPRKAAALCHHLTFLQFLRCPRPCKIQSRLLKM